MSSEAVTHQLPVARGLGRAESIHWPLKPSIELFELRYGKALVESARRPGSIPVYGTNGQTGTHDTALFAGPGVVLGRKGMGNLGVEWVDHDFWVIDTAYALRPRVDMDLKFAYYLIRHVGLNHLKLGTSNPSLTREAFGAQLFPVPPISAQRRIAAVLGTLDDKLASNERVARAAEAVWLAHATHRLADASPIPAQELTRDGVLLINDGYRAKNSELADDGVPFVRAGNLTSRGLELDDADRVPVELASNVGIKRSAAWDTAFTSKGTVGRITLVPPMLDFVYSPQVCFWRSVDPQRLSPFALHAWMRSVRFTTQVNAVKGQTDMADYVSLRDQRAMVIDIPSAEDQREIDALAVPLQRSAVTNRAEAQRLRAIRDELLPKLVSGKIRVALGEEIAEAGDQAALEEATAA